MSSRVLPPLYQSGSLRRQPSSRETPPSVTIPRLGRSRDENTAARFPNVPSRLFGLSNEGYRSSLGSSASSAAAPGDVRDVHSRPPAAASSLASSYGLNDPRPRRSQQARPGSGGLAECGCSTSVVTLSSTAPASSCIAAAPSTSAPAPAAAIKCDKCDGPHPTDSCPWFKKARERHPDAARAANKKSLGDASGPVEVIHGARVVRQPADGSCLFHSLSHGLRDGSTALSLRKQISAFIESNPELMISDSPLREWVLWDSASTVPAYCRRILSGGTWGGGIEMAVVSHLKKVNVHVYQSSSRGSHSYKRISCFAAPPGHDRIIRVLYCGGVHYDALELARPNESRSKY